MQMRSGLAFAGSVCVFICAVTVRLLASYQAFDFLKAQQPALYAWLISPTIINGTIFVGVALMGAVLMEMWRHKSPKAFEGQTARQQNLNALSKTHGSDSPATTIGTIGDIGPNANVVIGAKVSAAHVGNTSAGKEKPHLISRGIRPKSCEIPVYDEQLGWLNESPFRRMPTSCVAFAIRNDAHSRDAEADNVVAHLDFVSPDHAPISVDEGWWCEDVEDSGTHTFYIGSAETKYLVVAVSADKNYFAFGKEYKRVHGRNMPSEPSLIGAGQWYLTIEITGDGLSQFFYSEGQVNKDGNSNWTDPVTMRPGSWDSLLKQ